MGSAGIECEIRDRGMGNENIDKRLDFFLIEHYDDTIRCFDSMSNSQKQSLLDALELDEDQLKQGSHNVEQALTLTDMDAKTTIDKLIRQIS